MHGSILSKNEQITQALMDVVLFMALPKPSRGEQTYISALLRAEPPKLLHFLGCICQV